MHTLTLRQKQQLYEEYLCRKKAGEKATQAALAGWAKESYKLDRILNQSSISRIIRDGPQLLRNESVLSVSAKRNRSAASPRLEKALFKWVCDQNNRGVSLSGELVIMQARKMLRMANAHLPEEEQIKLNFSNGWIERFKKRHNIRFRRVHGEAKSADDSAIRSEMPRILSLMNNFADKDIWNADEFGLFFRQPPTWTLSSGPVSGFKKEKNRLTFLACTNKDGSEKRPLLIIGNAERPRPFKKKYGHDLGLDWHFNAKAWMNRQIFFNWLQRLDRYIGRTAGRKILLLIDNCSAHGKKEDLPFLQNVRVEFLPPNTTSKVQPLDAGIIAWVKRRYKRRLLLRVFENIEANAKSIYNVDVLTAIRWTEREWEECPASVIENCFKHCFKKEGEEDPGSDDALRDEEVLAQMSRDASEHGVHVNTDNLSNLLNQQGENNVTEEVTIEDLSLEVAGIECPTDEQESSDSDEDVPANISAQIQSLSYARSVLQRYGNLTEESSKAIYETQRTLRLEKQQKMTQTTIQEHFSQK